MNRMRTLLINVCFIFCIIGALNGTTEISAQPKPKLVVDSAFHDYGEVLRGEKVSHSFVIKNEGEATLIIKDAKPG